MKVEIRRDVGGWIPAVAAAAAAVAGATTWFLWRRNGSQRDGPELLTLRRTLRENLGAEKVHPRCLGRGIVELVGPVETRERANELLEAVSHLEGVEVVVDRLWVGGRSWASAGTVEPRGAA